MPAAFIESDFDTATDRKPQFSESDFAPEKPTFQDSDFTQANTATTPPPIAPSPASSLTPVTAAATAQFMPSKYGRLPPARSADERTMLDKGLDEPTFNLGDALIRHDKAFGGAEPLPATSGPQAEVGVEETLRPALNSLTTPRNLAYIAATMGISSIPKVGTILASAIWAAVMGKEAVKEAPKIAAEIGKEMGKPENERDSKKIAKGFTQLGVTTAMAVAPAIHLGGEVGKATGEKSIGLDELRKTPNLLKPSLLSATADAIAPIAPLTAEAIKQTAGTVQAKAESDLNKTIGLKYTPPSEAEVGKAVQTPSEAKKPVSEAAGEVKSTSESVSATTQPKVTDEERQVGAVSKEVPALRTQDKGSKSDEASAPETSTKQDAIDRISGLTTKQFRDEFGPGKPGAQVSAQALGDSLRGDTEAVTKLKDAKANAEADYRFAAEQATNVPTESRLNDAATHAQKVQYFSEAIARSEDVKSPEGQVAKADPGAPGETAPIQGEVSGKVAPEVSKAEVGETHGWSVTLDGEPFGVFKREAQARMVASGLSGKVEVKPITDASTAAPPPEPGKVIPFPEQKQSRQKTDRPHDLIDEIEGNHTSSISLNSARKIQAGFKPTGAARKLFSAGDEGMDIDKLADALRRNGTIPEDATEGDVLDAIQKSAESRKGVVKETAKQKTALSTESTQQQAFEEATQPAKGKEQLVPDTLFPGDEFTVDGHKVKVKEFEFDGDGNVTSVTLDDGNKFGTRQVESGTAIHVDEGSVKEKGTPEFAPKPTVEKPALESPKPAPPPPKLRPGEKKTGEMFQGEDQPFNLSGEKGTDSERITAEKAKAEQTKKEAAELAAKQQQGFTGMGGAIASEFGRDESVISNMFAAIDRDRAEMGKDPMPDTKARTWDEDNTKALAKMNRDPAWIPDLIQEVLDKPRPILSWENAGLVWQRQAWKAELNNALGRISRSFDDGIPDRLAEAKLDAARYEDKLEELDRAVGRSGTGSEAGRTLQAQKMGTGEDFTLVEMRLRKRAAVGGRPLTDVESAEIAKLHEQIAATEKAHNEYVLQSDKTKSELEAKLAIEQQARDVRKEPIVPPHIKIVADRVRDYFDKRGDAALKRLSGKLFTLSPQVLADLTDLGVSRILSGAIEFGAWSTKMAEALGDRIKPHLQTVWESAQAALNDHIQKIAGAKAEKVSRAVKGTDINEEKARVTEVIKNRIGAGKRGEITQMVQKLARIFVEQGVKEREQLIDDVHRVLKDIDPDFSRRDTMDAISGYGDFKQLTKDQISRELRDLKGQMQQAAKLEDMQANKPPLKTGVERRIPSKEESRLIKLVNEAKQKFQIPITDPNTQLKSSLDTLKTRMANRIDELNQKMVTKDFIKRPRHEIILDAVGQRLAAEQHRVKQRFERMLIQDRLKNRSMPEKIMDTFTKWRRGFVLSSPVTLGKLTAAAVARMVVTPMEEAVGAGISRLIPGVAERAPREGGFNSRAEARAITQGFTQGMRDAWKTLKTGQSDLDVLQGGKLDPATGEGLVLDKSVIDYIGNSHGMLKAPIKRAEFERSLQKRVEHAIRHGADPTDPMVMIKLSTAAYKDANRAIFLQDNVVVDIWKRGMSRLEQRDKLTGRTPLGQKAIATTVRALLPIVKVPTNIVAETFQYAVGSVTGLGRLANAFRKGVETLPPEQADLIMRELKKGSLGGAVLLTGYLFPNLFGGYYQKGVKRKRGDIKPGGARIPGVELPKVIGGPDISPKLLHSPFLEAAQMGSTIRRVADSKLKKSDSEPQGVPTGVLAAGLGLAEEAPFVREMLEITKAWSPHERGAFFGELGKTLLIPQGVQWAAQASDTDAKGNEIRRKTESIIDHITAGIPVARETLKENRKP